MRYLALFCFLLVELACNRTTDDLAGNATINGRLMYIDTLQLNPSFQPLAYKSVKIANAKSDTLNFLYSVKTDSAGYFSFVQLKKNTGYDLFYQDTLSGVRVTAFRAAVRSGNDTVLLQANPDYTSQNVLHFIVTDQTGGRLANARLCIFNSQLLYQADSCTGSIYQASSDADGRVSLFNVPAGTYYIRASAQFDSLALWGNASAVTVGQTNITTVVLSMAPLYPIGNLSFQITDNSGQPIPGGTVCVFDNQQLFQLANTECTGSIAQLNTDAYGDGVISGLHYGTYYCNVRVPLANMDTLKGSKTIVINQPGSTAVQIQVQ